MMTKYNKNELKHLDKYNDKKLKSYAKKIGINKEKVNKSSRSKLYKLVYKKYNKSAFKIQKFIRKNRTYKNDYTLLGDKVSDINNNLLYIIEGYAFNIIELNENLKISNVNPYTKKKISTNHITNIINRINKLEKKNINIKINNDIPQDSLITTKSATLFNKLSSLNLYPNVNIFRNYSNSEYLLYFKQIYKYSLIKEYFTEKDLDKLEKLEKNSNENKSIEIKYRCIGINILEKIIANNDYHNYTRGLILIENLVENIEDKYNLPIIDNNNLNYNINTSLFLNNDFNDLYTNILNIPINSPSPWISTLLNNEADV